MGTKAIFPVPKMGTPSPQKWDENTLFLHLSSPQNWDILIYHYTLLSEAWCRHAGSTLPADAYGHSVIGKWGNIPDLFLALFLRLSDPRSSPIDRPFDILSRYVTKQTII